MLRLLRDIGKERVITGIAVFACVLGCALQSSAAEASSEQVLWSFGNGTDGESPYAGLINVGGTLYGTTALGGVYGQGTVYSLNPTNGAETVVWSFGNRTDGSQPYNNLVKVGSRLYGTTAGGGADYAGTLFSLNLKTGHEKVLYSFCSQANCTDGQAPEFLINVNRTLYGTTNSGGTDSRGTLFSFDTKTHAETVLWSFGNGSDGTLPYGGLININGTLYGTTYSGGIYGYGTVFSFSPTTNVETVLWSFGVGPDGLNPNGGLTNVSGTLFGTTDNGGAYGYGTVFSLDSTTDTEAAVWSFGNGTDGQSPNSALTNLRGMLYGTTLSGGAHGYGTVFSLTPEIPTETVLWSFGNSTDGDTPNSNLLNVKGTFYGTTVSGGTYGHGTVFEIVP